MTEQIKMWAVHVIGPDDLHACPDREVADALALLLNRQFKQFHQNIKAEVVEWPYGYETWKADSEMLCFVARPSSPSKGGGLTQCDMHEDESR